MSGEQTWKKRASAQVWCRVCALFVLQGIAEMCNSRVNKAIQAMDVNGEIVGTGVLAKVPIFYGTVSRDSIGIQ